VKFRSERRANLVGGHNGYPVFYLPLIPFANGHRTASPDDWEVTFTQIRSDAPHRDAVRAHPVRKRDGGSSGCDRFVASELAKLMKAGSGEVTRLGAAREQPRQYQLNVHRSKLADGLAKKSEKAGRSYAKPTILKALSKFAVSPKGPCGVAVSIIEGAKPTTLYCHQRRHGDAAGVSATVSRPWDPV